MKWREGLSSLTGRLTFCEGVPGTHWIKNWLGYRADLDAVMRKKK
jgi:hypothetical protein